MAVFALAWLLLAGAGGEALVLVVAARALLGRGGDEGGRERDSSSEEQRSMTSLLALACLKRALRLGPRLDGGDLAGAGAGESVWLDAPA